MLTPKLFTEFLSSEGRSLSEINPGSNEVALAPSNALRAIDLLSGSQVAILGGDLLSDKSGKLAYSYENWYCDKKPSENPIGFVNRSQAIAREFIGKLMERDDNNIYVVLVYSELGVV